MGSILIHSLVQCEHLFASPGKQISGKQVNKLERALEYCDRSKTLGVRSRIQCTKPSRPTTPARCLMCAQLVEGRGTTKIFPVVLQLRQECLKSPQKRINRLLHPPSLRVCLQFVHRRNHVTDTIEIRDDSIVSLFKACGLS